MNKQQIIDKLEFLKAQALNINFELIDIMAELQEQKTEPQTQKRVFEQMSDEGIDTSFYFEFFEENFPGAFIWGNRDFCDFGIDEIIKNIIDDSCNDEEILQNLKKETGKDYKQRTLRGYCQSDWQNLFFVEGTLTEKQIDYIEAYYFGMVQEYFDTVEECCFIVCDFEDTKTALAEQTGEDKNNIIIKKITGYIKTPVFEEE